MAKVRKAITVVDVGQAEAERAAEALRQVYGTGDGSTVKHVIDAMLKAVADRLGAVVITGDPADLGKLWDWFPKIRFLYDKDGNQILKRT